MIGVPEPGTMRLCLAEPNPKGLREVNYFYLRVTQRLVPSRQLIWIQGLHCLVKQGF